MREKRREIGVSGWLPPPTLSNPWSPPTQLLTELVALLLQGVVLGLQVGQLCLRAGQLRLAALQLLARVCQQFLRVGVGRLLLAKLLFGWSEASM